MWQTFCKSSPLLITTNPLYYKQKGGGRMDEMNNQETIKICVEEFSRLQEWMEMTEKGTPLYKSMKVRYRDLKVILSALGVNVTELDTIKE